MKQRKKQKGIRPVLCGVLMLVMMLLIHTESHAYTSDNVPGVQFTPDGGAWTVVEPLPEDTDPSSAASYWLESGIPFDTGLPLNLPTVGTGQHLYKYDRRDEMIPVYQWVSIHRPSACYHGGNSNDFHELVWDNNICGEPYWSGLAPICADCGEQVCSYMHYMSPSTAQKIQYVNTAKDYYYQCNHCGHLEQAVKYDHECSAVSYNQYVIEYESTLAGTVGIMQDSKHMYNNATMLDGKEVTPDKYLSKNIFTRQGYVFLYWTTNPDGTGEKFYDEQEIYNLTAEHYNPNTGEGIVTLYAQWKKSSSTLHIDANGGEYNDSKGTRNGDKTTFANIPFGTVLELSKEKLTAPMGYKVSFVSAYGKQCSPIQLRQEFVAWKNIGTLKGRFINPKYAFIGPDGSVDTLQALYEHVAITLPDPAAGVDTGKLVCVGWLVW